MAASRSRPRAGQIKDEMDEERSIWSQIREYARRVDSLVSQSNMVSRRIVDLAAQQEVLIKRGNSPSDGIDSEIEKATRENLRLTDEIKELGDELCEKMQILSGLRDAPEPTSSRPRPLPSIEKPHNRPPKRKPIDPPEEKDNIIESPTGQPSPKVNGGVPTNKKIAAFQNPRPGSVQPSREPSVKIEDDDAKEKHRLAVNTEVLYRNNKNRSLEGEGILCRVTSVIGEGKQRRYEIIDADPDPPTPAQPYRASVNHLVAIPPLVSNTTLPDLKIGRQVLALYPGTTTFYKAEVVGPWTGKKEIKEEGKDESENLVRLRFEGEDEADREMSVERRYVLPDK